MESTAELETVRYSATGSYLAQTRQKAGVSQQDVATVLGLKNASFIGHCERGRAPFPSCYWLKYCELVGVDPRDFARKMVWFTDPMVWAMLNGLHSPGLGE